MSTFTNKLICLNFSIGRWQYPAIMVKMLRVLSLARQSSVGIWNWACLLDLVYQHRSISTIRSLLHTLYLNLLRQFLNRKIVTSQSIDCNRLWSFKVMINIWFVEVSVVIKTWIVKLLMVKKQTPIFIDWHRDTECHHFHKCLYCLALKYIPPFGNYS